MTERLYDECVYRIKVQDDLDEKHFNASSPHRVSVLRAGPILSLFTVRTDQSGLLGLLRHLHSQGYLLLSLDRDM